MAENGSCCKDLLQLEQNSTATASTTCLESKLFVCKKDGGNTICQSGAPTQKPTIFPIPTSDVLGKVKNFLGVISESNKDLLYKAKENPENYDIEVLNGTESNVIEMDLMLGIADLHTPEAVAAAESAMAGYQPAIHHMSESSSRSYSEDCSDEDDNDSNNDNNNHNDKRSKHVSKPDSNGVESGLKDIENDHSCVKPKKQKTKKRPKIVELS